MFFAFTAVGNVRFFIALWSVFIYDFGQIDDNRFYFMDYFGHLILAYQKDGENYYASSVNDEKYAQKEGAFIESTLRQLQQNTEQ